MSEAPNLYDTGSLDEAAGRLLSEMYARHGRALYGLCRMMLRDPHEAEDALQSTFLSAYRSLVSGNVPREESAWLATIARNECRGRIRERMRRPVTAEAAELEGVADTAGTPEELIADDRVGKALAALPESQREAVVLHDLFGLRAREVGAALGLSVPAVEAVLFRARRQLRTRLRPVGASALSLPLGIQEALTLQIPGFAAGGAGAGTVAVGAGLLAKVVATPTVLKVAAGAAALATAGSVAVVGKHQASAPPRQQTQQGSRTGDDTSSHAAGAETDALNASTTGSHVSGSGQGTGSASGRGEHAGPGNGGSGSDDPAGHATSAPGGDDGATSVEPGQPGHGSSEGGRGTGAGGESGSDGGGTTDGGKLGSSGESGSPDSGSGSGSSGHGGSDDGAAATTDGSGEGTETEPSSSGEGGGSGTSGDAPPESRSGSGSGGSNTSGDSSGSTESSSGPGSGSGSGSGSGASGGESHSDGSGQGSSSDVGIDD